MAETLTHYFPWDQSDTFAFCGHRMTAQDTHSPQPTCPGCVEQLAAEDAALEAEVDAAVAVPLDAEEAALAGLKVQAAALATAYEATPARGRRARGTRARLEDGLADLHAAIADLEAAREARDRQEDVVEQTMSAFGQTLFAFGVTLARGARS